MTQVTTRPMNPAAILWPDLPAAVIFLDPEHPGAGRYEPPLPAPKLPDGFYAKATPAARRWLKALTDLNSEGL